MAYVEGFVVACPKANRQAFIDQANRADSIFIEMGATRVVECWGDDVPDGQVTDFRMAVKAEADEDVVFSWIEWPDKATRDAAKVKMMAMMSGDIPADPRVDAKVNPMPFDGMRMIYGGFAPVVELNG